MTDSLRQDQRTLDTNSFRDETTAGALLRSEDRFRLLVEAVRDYALDMLDSQGYILCWNAGASRLTGYEADEMMGQHLSHLYADESCGMGHPASALKEAA